MNEFKMFGKLFSKLFIKNKPRRVLIENILTIPLAFENIPKKIRIPVHVDNLIRLVDLF